MAQPKALVWANLRQLMLRTRQEPQAKETLEQVAGYLLQLEKQNQPLQSEPSPPPYPNLKPQIEAILKAQDEGTTRTRPTKQAVIKALRNLVAT